MKSIARNLILILLGGLMYICIELLWRGYSHWTMFVVGGLCFFLIGSINELLTYEMSLTKQMAIAAVIITVVEFIAGMIVNKTLGLNVWDYSHIPYNLHGQVCLRYSILWFFLSAPGIYVDDILREKLFDEPFEGYQLFVDRKGGEK